jgi:perosamine synthetase
MNDKEASNRHDSELGEEIRSWAVNIPSNALNEIRETLESGWINTGPKEKRFREILVEIFQAKHAVACNSGTSALRLALASAGVGVGDEVISTAYTWLATNTAILEQGARPVFADINYDTLNLDPAEVEKKISKKTKAIIVVHYAGNSVDLDAFRQIAKHHNLVLIEDSAHAMGSKYNGIPIGAGSDFACFSFQCVKIVTCGDGGAVLTDREEYYDALKKRVWYGIDRDRKKADFLDPVPHMPEVLGFKMNMNDIVASLACSAMSELESALLERAKIGYRYDEFLKSFERIKAVSRPDFVQPNYQIFPVHVDNRLEFANFMWERGIQVNVNNRRNDLYPVFGGICDLPELERADNDTILLPLHLMLEAKHLSRIEEALYDYEKS